MRSITPKFALPKSKASAGKNIGQRQEVKEYHPESLLQISPAS